MVPKIPMAETAERWVAGINPAMTELENRNGLNALDNHNIGLQTPGTAATCIAPCQTFIDKQFAQ